MSDIADSGAFNSNLARITSDNYGPSAVASQGQTNAQTGLIQQQAQGAAIQNRNAQLQFQLFRQGIAHLSDFSGQDGPTLGAGVNDSSGVTAASASPAGAPSADASGATPEDGIGQSASDQARLQAATEQKYNVDPAGSPAEQNAILQAHAYAVQMKLSGNKGLADAAEERVNMLKEQRDMNVTSRKNLAALDANEHYDKLSAAESAPEGKAFEILQNVMPETAKNLKKGASDASPEELDEITRDSAGHMAAFLHRFTNRPVKVGDDGATYDEQSGMRVDVPIRGVSAERQASLLEQANKIVTTKNSDNTETTEPQYRKDGYQNPGQWVTDAVAKIRSRNGAQNVVEAAGNHAAQYGHLQPGAPPVPGGTLYRGPQPGQQPQPGAPAAQRPTSTPAAGAAAMNARLLPGPDGAPINLDGMPRANLPPAVSGRTANPQEQAQLDAFKENYKGMQTDAMRKLSETNQADALLTPFQQKLNTINSRDVGPGSTAYKALLDLKGAITGKAPNDLVDMGVIDKFANQLGVQNVRQLLSGQRITNQEMMNFLTRASASVTQPIDVMKTIVSYQKANNDFDRRLATTQLAGLAKHVDPAALQGLENGREDYVRANAEGRVRRRATVDSSHRYDEQPQGCAVLRRQHSICRIAPLSIRHR